MPDTAVVMEMARNVAREAGFINPRTYLEQLGFTTKKDLPQLWQHIVAFSRAKEETDRQQNRGTQAVQEDSLLSAVTCDDDGDVPNNQLALKGGRPLIMPTPAPVRTPVAANVVKEPIIAPRAHDQLRDVPTPLRDASKVVSHKSPAPSGGAEAPSRSPPAPATQKPSPATATHAPSPATATHDEPETIPGAADSDLPTPTDMPKTTAPSIEYKAEYKTFMHQVANRQVFPVALAKDFKTNRKDLFDLWRNNDRDWAAVQLRVQRKAAKVTKSEVEKSMIKVRDLVKGGMPQEKAERIRDKRRAEKLAEWDPDFPKDIDEIRFWYDSKISSSEGNITEEGMSVNGNLALDRDMTEQVIGQGGILQAGLRASAPGVAEDQQLSFAESMSNALTNETCGKLVLTKVPKTDPKPDGATNEDAKPTGPKSKDVIETETKKIVMSKLDEINKEIKEATSLEMVLQAHAICPATAQGMSKHVALMSRNFKALTKKLEENSPAVSYHG